MALSRAFLEANVMHARTAPKRHVLNYAVWYLCVGLHELPALKGLRMLRCNSHGFYSLYDKDYGTGDTSIETWINTIKADYSIAADGPTYLVTMPRTAMYGFNPVSFWFMTDQTGALRAVLAEVNNTFGERHCYLCRHADGRAIAETDWLHAEKVFHVSPFMKVSGTYDFRFRFNDEQVGVWINYNDEGRQMLVTSLIGRREPLTNRRLVSAFFTHPLLTLKVIGLIHWHALRLVLKGIRYNRKPQPPATMVSQ